MGCSKTLSKQDVIDGKLEVCNNLINLFIPPEVEKYCSYDSKNDKVLINVRNHMNSTIVYDSKTGEVIR